MSGRSVEPRVRQMDEGGEDSYAFLSGFSTREGKDVPPCKYAEQSEEFQDTGAIDNVYSYLMQMGIFYNERKLLLSRKKMLEELKERSAHPVKYPFVIQYKKQQNAGGADLSRRDPFSFSEHVFQINGKEKQKVEQLGFNEKKKGSIKKETVVPSGKTRNYLFVEENMLEVHNGLNELFPFYGVQGCNNREKERIFLEKDEEKNVSGTSCSSADPEKDRDHLCLSPLGICKGAHGVEGDDEDGLFRPVVKQDCCASERYHPLRSPPSFPFQSFLRPSPSHVHNEEEPHSSPSSSHHHKDDKHIGEDGDYFLALSTGVKPSAYCLSDKISGALAGIAVSLNEKCPHANSNESVLSSRSAVSCRYSVKALDAIDTKGDVQGVHRDKEDSFSSLFSGSSLVEMVTECRKEAPSMHSKKRDCVRKEKGNDGWKANEFSPALCPASRQIVKQKRQEAMTRGKPMRSPSTRLHANAAVRRNGISTSFSSERNMGVGASTCRRPSGGKRNSQPSFHPQISVVSEKLWRHRVKEAQTKNRSLSNATEIRTALWEEANRLKEEKLEQRRWKNSRDLLRECTFQPLCHSSTAGLPEKQRAGGSQSPLSCMSVAERNALWAAQKARKLERKRALLERDELEECTFQPNAHRHAHAKRSQSGSLTPFLASQDEKNSEKIFSD